jgi:hypothetical protein
MREQGKTAPDGGVVSPVKSPSETQNAASSLRHKRFDFEGKILGSPTWTRTRDLRINSPSLYQLSYQGIVPGLR